MKHPMVFLAHESGVKGVEKYMRAAIDNGWVPVSSLVLYDDVLSKNESELGLKITMDIISRCDELWICGKATSPEMLAQHDYAEFIGIHVRELDSPKDVPE